jgi:tyrosine-specific transport protein
MRSAAPLLVCGMLPLAALSFSIRTSFGKTTSTTISARRPRYCDHHLYSHRSVPPATEAERVEPSSKILKASLLIAGTTVGGGFLALPQTVVVPLGGFVPSAISLAGVWLFFLAQNLVLCECLLQCHADSDSGADTNAIGIPSLARYALGPGGSILATALLIVLTEATLVSQLSRAGSLFADSSGSVTVGASMGRYRTGCVLSATVGAILSFFGGGRRTNSNGAGRSTSSGCSPLDPSTGENGPQLLAPDHPSSSLQPSRLAADANALLTMVFLASAILLFRAGCQTAIWSQCLETSSMGSTKVLVQNVAKAVPTMLQLLTYGEIIPNVCHMLNYNANAIRTTVLLGSFIPLLLLTGWAGLGVALLGPLTSGGDPVQVLLATGSAPVRTRLLVLAASAIGTTILGSCLALESAYKDLVSMSHRVGRTRIGKILYHPFCMALSIVLPPLAISITSPSIFLRAIDFAGSYPVLLLFGVIPPVMALRLRSKDFIKGPVIRYVSLALLSVSMVAINAVPDIQRCVAWLVGSRVTSLLMRGIE